MPQRVPARTDSPQRRRLWWAAVAASVLAVAGIGTWLLWPEEPRQREYLDVTACLLTDESGVAGAAAKPVWAALQEASVASRARVQYLAVAGPQTEANARAHAASLAGGRCGLVIAVGPTQVDAASATAQTFPQVRFLTVDSGTASANVAVVPAAPADALRTAIARELSTLADSAS